MPFNFWCGGCERHIAHGVRFNAEKSQNGEYLGLPIWAFRMKCPSCSQIIVLRTDPQHGDYTVVEGGRRKIERVDADAAASLGMTEGTDGEKMSNPFFRLEHGLGDARKLQESIPKLRELQRQNEEIWKDDYGTSRMLRKRFREEKKLLKEEDKKSKHSVPMRLLPERLEDVSMARNTFSGEEQLQRRIAKRTKELEKESIFKK